MLSYIDYSYFVVAIKECNSNLDLAFEICEGMEFKFFEDEENGGWILEYVDNC